MGNSPNRDQVDFEAFKTREDLRAFLAMVQNDNNEIIKRAEAIDAKLIPHDVNQDLQRLVKAWAEVHIDCAVPKTVMWLSADARQKCTDAHTRFGATAQELFVTAVNSNVNTKELRDRTSYLNALTKANSKYL
jgi:hypothetical protein